MGDADDLIYLSVVSTEQSDPLRYLNTEEEAEAAASIPSPSMQRAFLTGRSLARTVISQIRDSPASDIRFTETARPEVVGDGDIDFSISYSRPFVAIAVTVSATLSVGVDIETIEPLPQRLLARVLGPLGGLGDSDEIHRTFYSRWTVKEAGAKVGRVPTLSQAIRGDQPPWHRTFALPEGPVVTVASSRTARVELLHLVRASVR